MKTLLGNARFLGNIHLELRDRTLQILSMQYGVKHVFVLVSRFAIITNSLVKYKSSKITETNVKKYTSSPKLGVIHNQCICLKGR